MRVLALCVLAGCFGGGGGGHGGPPHGDAADATSPGGDAPACVPKSCAQPVLACNDVDDGCGGTLHCGACPGDLACGAVQANTCGAATPACTNGWCWASPLPFGNDLRAVWAASPSDAWAVGEGGTMLRFDGATWHALPAVTSGPLNAVWGASAGDVWVGGNDYVGHWNGSALGKLTTGPGQYTGIRGISGTGASDVLMAGDGNTDLFHWSGSAWSADGNPWGFDDVCAVAPGVGYAVGFFNAYRYASGAWADLAAGPSTGSGCYGSAANDVWIASDKLQHFDGTAWSTDAAWPVVEALWGASAHDIWATTDGGLVHWDGSAWSAPQPSDPIARIASGFAVGPNGRSYRLDGAHWTQLSGFGASYALGALCAFADDTALAIGNGMLRYRGGVVEDLGATGLADVAGAYCASPADAWAVADFALQHYDGARWSAAVALAAEPAAIWGSGASDVWVATRSSDTFHNGPAYVVHYDGASWTIATQIVIADNSFALDLAVIGGSGPHDVWAAGGLGVVLHFDGSAWTRLDLPDQATPSAISVAADGTPFLVGSAIWTRKGGAWVSIGSGPTQLTARAANDVWGSDRNGSVWHYDGSGWTETRSGAGQPLLAPALGGASAFIAGQNGGILRKH